MYLCPDLRNAFCSRLVRNLIGPEMKQNGLINIPGKQTEEKMKTPTEEKHKKHKKHTSISSPVTQE